MFGCALDPIHNKKNYQAMLSPSKYVSIGRDGNVHLVDTKPENVVSQHSALRQLSRCYFTAVCSSFPENVLEI